MGKTTLTWDYDGLVGEGFKIYRADSPMDPDNLPLPIATAGIEDREYKDETVIDNETYYYRISSYLGDAERLSGEVEHIAESASDPHWDNVVALLHFDGDLTDDTGRVWSPVKAPLFAGGGVGNSLALTGTINTPYSANMDVLNNDFTIEFFVKAASWASWSRLDLSFHLPNAFGKMIGFASGTNYWSFGPTQSGKLVFIAYNNGNHVYLMSAGTVPTGELTHVSLVRSGNNIYASIGGVVELIGVVGVIQQGVATRFTIGEFNGSRREGLQDELRVTKGVARYTENFTPPTEPFPNF